MKRLPLLAALVLLATTAMAQADGLCLLAHGVHCVVPPPPDCVDCCDEIGGHHLCSAGKSAHAQELVCQLHASCCCDRIKAAHKLGHRLHADPCCDSEIVDALIAALQCDTCWEVRKAAAWALAYQKVRTRMAILALYVASRADPHYLVRDAAADALQVLVLCRGQCYKALFTAADALVVSIKPYYQPTKGNCVNIGTQCAALLGTIGGPVTAPPPAVVPGPGRTPEPLPLPSPAR